MDKYVYVRVYLLYCAYDTLQHFFVLSEIFFSAVSSNLENSKLEEDAPDEEDDGQRRRKRPKKVPSKENLDQSGIYQSHPLKVTLHINDDEASDLNSTKLITLKFEFLIKLNVVCVGVEGSEEVHLNNILCNLFPDDTGLELPQQVCFSDCAPMNFMHVTLPILIKDFATFCSQQSCVLEILSHLTKGEHLGHTNGPSIWQELIFYLRCLHCFQSLKNQIVKLLSILLFYRACQFIANKIGCRLLCKGFVPGKRLSWLLRESLPSIFSSYGSLRTNGCSKNLAELDLTF